jgi:hypothetical protein
LVDGQELEDAVSWRGDLPRLLRRKRDSLMIHREVLVASHIKKRRKAGRLQPGQLAPTATEFVFPDGRRSTSLSCRGDFGQFVFVTELPDIDWVPASGAGVSVDIPISLSGEADLVAIVNRLSDMGWTTDNARWSIQQATTNWHGLGGQSFVDALADWANRYKPLKVIHHSEELCYFDVCDGGFYSLTANIAASKPRIVRHADLSFQLTGIPLDMEPLSQLCHTFEIDAPVYFRPRETASVSRDREPSSERPMVEPVAFIVDANNIWEDDAEDDESVAGIVVRNPNYRRRVLDWLPEMLTGSEFLVCDLKSWHELGAIKSTYRLCSCESAWTSDALVVRPRVDWDDEDRDGGVSLIVPAMLPTSGRGQRKRRRIESSPFHVAGGARG